MTLEYAKSLLDKHFRLRSGYQGVLGHPEQAAIEWRLPRKIRKRSPLFSSFQYLANAPSDRGADRRRTCEQCEPVHAGEVGEQRFGLHLGRKDLRGLKFLLQRHQKSRV